MSEETEGSKVAEWEGLVWSRLALNDPEDWPKRYPYLCPIEWLHSRGFNPDPFLVLKTDGDPVDTTFFVAGYSTGGAEDDARFYGLMLDHGARRMAWVEIRGRELRWEGPGECRYVVDEAWQRTRYSEAVRGYPDYTFGSEVDEERHPRYPLVTARSLGELKGWLQTDRGIDTVTLVGDYFDLAKARYSLAAVDLGMGRYDRDERKKQALELAAHGLLRFAVKELASVPREWRPYAVALSGLPDGQPCRVTYMGGMYYVRLVGKILPPSGPLSRRNSPRNLARNRRELPR